MYTTQTSNISPNDNDYFQEGTFAKKHCCCFPFFNTQPSSGSGSIFWQRINPLDANNIATSTSTTSSSDAWWVRGWKRMREWSEIVAGPKWKTLIRKIGKKQHIKHGGYRNAKYRYDPLSYARNFDEGLGQNDHYDEDMIGRGFSSRYSLPPSCKTSLDFDKEGLLMVLE